MIDPAKTLYYVIHISTTASRERGTSMCWSKPYDTTKDANNLQKELHASGEASISFIARFRGGERIIMEEFVRPNQAMKIVRHYLDVDEALAAHESPPK